MSAITRGDVFYVEMFQVEGSEMRPGRPAIIVSNDLCNEYSEVVEVVYMTTKPKADMSTHVTIRSMPKRSVALCEQITSVSKSRLGNWLVRLTPDEMASVERAMMISLDLGESAKSTPKYTEPEIQPAEKAGPTENEIVLRTQRDTYKAMYENLLERLSPAMDRSA